LNGPFESSDIKLEADIGHPRFEQLKKWSASGASINVTALTEKAKDSSAKKEQLYTIAEVRKNVSENQEVTSGTKAGFYMITGFIASILHGDESNPKTLFYLACPSCKKKVIDEYNSYKCERCDKVYA
jgi:Zn finger protein HypA/HybF involved in hydrogenase expression